MKKFTVLAILMLSMGFVLTGCTTNTDTAQDNSNLQQKVVDRSEYQFKFTVKGSDGSEMSSKIYKKGDNSMTEFIKMVGGDAEEMPFIPKKTVTVGGTTYQQVEKDGKTFWFSIPGEYTKNDMFNLKEMSTVDMSIVTDTKREKINGKKMTCYYIDNVADGKGKSCLYKGIFAYGEFTESGAVQTVEVSDYDDSVKDSVFAAPDAKDILSTQDMMKMFQ